MHFLVLAYPHLMLLVDWSGILVLDIIFKIFKYAINFSKVVFNVLKLIYNMPLVLHCFPTAIDDQGICDVISRGIIFQVNCRPYLCANVGWIHQQLATLVTEFHILMEDKLF